MDFLQVLNENEELQMRRGVIHIPIDFIQAIPSVEEVFQQLGFIPLQSVHMHEAIAFTGLSMHFKPLPMDAVAPLYEWDSTQIITYVYRFKDMPL